MLEFFINGFGAILNPGNMLIIFLGVAIGIIFGAIPGLTSTMAVALCLPITFGMEPIMGMSMLAALYIGGVSGGLIAAILLNIPGTPASIATCFDGHPLAAKGEAGKALGVGIVFSFLGGMVSFLALFFIAPPLARFALKFSPYEYFSISIFALTLIAGLTGKSMVRGLISGCLGMAFATIGMAPLDGLPRFTFGNEQLISGFNLLSVLIGLYAFSEMFIYAETCRTEPKAVIQKFEIRGFGFSIAEFKSQLGNFSYASILGTGIGILPGIGASTANIIAYMGIKNRSKYPEKFGTGIIDGIVASETANNATVGGALIPLLTLGIPGDGVTALLLGALMIHGITPGPMLFSSGAEIVYGLFAALIISNIAMLILEFFGIRIFVRLLKIPKHILLPVVLSLCFVGGFTLGNRIFDIWVLLLFGIIGYIMLKVELPLPPVILGFILGPIAETNLRRGFTLSKGSFIPFMTSPISGTFLALAVASVVIIAYKNQKSKVKKAEVSSEA
ncbi:MAG: tripartite tricarboxylate transporter permease [Clostridia bacterium]